MLADGQFQHRMPRLLHRARLVEEAPAIVARRRSGGDAGEVGAWRALRQDGCGRDAMAAGDPIDKADIRVGPVAASVAVRPVAPHQAVAFVEPQVSSSVGAVSPTAAAPIRPRSDRAPRSERLRRIDGQRSQHVFWCAPTGLHRFRYRRRTCARGPSRRSVSGPNGMVPFGRGKRAAVFIDEANLHCFIYNGCGRNVKAPGAFPFPLVRRNVAGHNGAMERPTHIQIRICIPADICRRAGSLRFPTNLQPVRPPAPVNC